MNTYEYILYNHSKSTISSDTSPLAMVVYHHMSKNTWNCTPGLKKMPEIAVFRRLIKDDMAGRSYSWSKYGDLPNCTAMIVSSQTTSTEIKFQGPLGRISRFPACCSFETKMGVFSTPETFILDPYGWPLWVLLKIGFRPWGPLTSVSHDSMAPGWWHRECFRCRFGLRCLNEISHGFFGISNWWVKVIPIQFGSIYNKVTSVIAAIIYQSVFGSQPSCCTSNDDSRVAGYW